MGMERRQYLPPKRNSKDGGLMYKEMRSGKGGNEQTTEKKKEGV